MVVEDQAVVHILFCISLALKETQTRMTKYLATRSGDLLPMGTCLPRSQQKLKGLLELGFGLGFLSSGGRSTPFPVQKMAVSHYSG